MSNQVLISGGQVFDGTASSPQAVDVLIEGDRIAQVGPKLPQENCAVVDAGGLIVCPGLIDLHVHCYDGMGIYAIDPADAGLKTGVTTMLDTGSAGSLTYEAFHKYVMPEAREDIFALLNISQLGAQGNPQVEPFIGELTDVRHVYLPSCVECIETHRDRIIGSKVRLTADLAADKPEHEYAAMRGAVEAAQQTGTVCMFHHKSSSIPLDEALAALRPGDIYTHVFHPGGSSGFGEDGRPLGVMQAARQRGIVFDVGHGIGSFGWRVAERACVDHGFWPDTISTDIHRLNLHGPVYDLPTTMSKFLHLGMPLAEVICATTSAPAKAMRMEDRFGRLLPGRQADVTLLRAVEGEFALYDTQGESRIANTRLVPVAVFKRGQQFPCQLPEDMREPAGSEVV